MLALIMKILFGLYPLILVALSVLIERFSFSSFRGWHDRLGIGLVGTLMSLQSTSVTLWTMFVGGLDTASTRVTVDIAPPILAGTRAARVAMLVGHVSPLPARVTVMVLWCWQL